MLASTAVADADLRVLLMCVYHLTGDGRWLAEPYKPAPDVDLAGDPKAGLSDEAAQRLRAVAAELIEMNIQPVINDPGNELVLEMMTWCLGEEVPAEHAPSMREELRSTSADAREPVDLDDFTGPPGARHLLERLPHYAAWYRLTERWRSSDRPA